MDSDDNSNSTTNTGLIEAMAALQKQLLDQNTQIQRLLAQQHEMLERQQQQQQQQQQQEQLLQHQQQQLQQQQQLLLQQTQPQQQPQQQQQLQQQPQQQPQQQQPQMQMQNEFEHLRLDEAAGGATSSGRTDSRRPWSRRNWRNEKVDGTSRNNCYWSWELFIKHPKATIAYKKIVEIEYDLFLMPRDYSLAHCVAEDLHMSSGIAVQFRHRFQRINELRNQYPQTGGLAVLRHHNQFIYYLVTKRYSSDKPTYCTLFSSLVALATHIGENNVKKLAIPRIGCGLDRLEWSKVKYMIEYIFQQAHLDVDIVVCKFR